MCLNYRGELCLTLVSDASRGGRGDPHLIRGIFVGSGHQDRGLVDYLDVWEGGWEG